MDTEQLIHQAENLRERIQHYSSDGNRGNFGHAAKAQVCEFLRAYAGHKSAFLQQAEKVEGLCAYQITTLNAILSSYVEYLRAGLATCVSPERRAQLDVVSDVLEQAHSLLEDEHYHPAAAAIIIGASLEEFLRTWVEMEGLSLGNSKPGIDTYCKVLRTGDLITKQDVKDITSWAGIRNDAAHGYWDQVSDRKRIRLMLEGTNLFMRQREGRGSTGS